MNAISSLNAEDISHRILRAASAVGTLSGSVGETRTLTGLCNPLITVNELAEQIGSEPALCARVLRVANSAYYLRQRKVKTVEQALLLLGLDAVRGIAAAASLDRAMPASSELTAAEMRAILCHSIATGMAAKELALRMRPMLASEALVAGLLHNFGIAIQLRVDSNAVAAMVNLRKSGDLRCITALEAECDAISHEAVIIAITEAWHLPVSIGFAAGFHHRSRETPDSYRDLASLVALAANIGLAAGYTSILEPEISHWDLDAAQHLGIEIEQVDVVGGQMIPPIRELVEAMLS